MGALGLTTNQAKAGKRDRANGEGGIWHDQKPVAAGSPPSPSGTTARSRFRRSVTGKTKKQVADRLRELQNATDVGQDPARRDLTVARFLEEWLDDVLPGTVSPATEVHYRARRSPLRRSACSVRSGYVPSPHETLPSCSATSRTRDAPEHLTAGQVRTPSGASMGRSGRPRGPQRRRHRGRRPYVDPPRYDHDVDQARHSSTTSKATGSKPPTPSHLPRAPSWGAARPRMGRPRPRRHPGPAQRATSPQTAARRGLVLEDAKTPQSHRTVYLPAPVATALREHRRRQAEERLALGPTWVRAPPRRRPRLPVPVPAPHSTPTTSATSPTRSPPRLASADGPRTSSATSPPSLLVAQGVPLKAVSETLGHSSIRVTADIYAHLQEPAKAEAAEAMTKALWSS